MGGWVSFFSILILVGDAIYILYLFAGFLRREWTWGLVVVLLCELQWCVSCKS